MEQNREKLAQRITDLMKTKGMKQTDLAEKTGITQAAVSQILSKDRYPTTPVLMKVAQVFTVSLDYLVGKSEDPGIAAAINNDDELQQFFRNFQSLKPEMQEILRHQAEMMKNQKK